MVYMLESQIAYVADALRVMRERGAAIAEVRPEVQAAYNRALDARMARSVWTTALLELVPGRDRAQRGAVAGLDLALPAPDAPLRPGRARAVRRRARTGGGGGVSARLHR